MTLRGTTFLIASGLLAGCSYTISPQELEAYRQLRTPSETVAGEAVCHIHQVETVEFLTKEVAGMCVEPSLRDRPYMKARVHLFPNSFWDTYSCFCEPMGSLRQVRVCPKCREAERSWRAAHRLSILEEYPLPGAG
jgi:hypothetical protein